MDIISEIKKKKELSDIPNSLIKEILEKSLKKNFKNSIEEIKNKKQLKIIIKEVRSELRKYTGRFQISSKKRIALLKENRIEELLKTHSSTKERFLDYKILKSEIKKLNPSSILDLGCGLNPIIIANNKIKYYAYDIKKDELNLISEFFKNNKINGKTVYKDIKKVKRFPKTDLTLILKVLDIIDQKGHRNAKEIIQKISSKNIIASFSLITLSGKPMSFPRRYWFEKTLEILNLKFKVKRTKTEIFYIINRLEI
ncbi:MAG: hypothetical protein Q8P57_02745 [Candidatus Pacearchaeota archaeon]|nr:hypothetical protein [Candidatus Pacearchaeota archaeon]